MTDTPAERGVDSTWTRLRRRKVVQWGLVYVAAAWGFLQGLEYVTETFHWPEQFRQISFLVLLIGMPIVLVLAWYHGDRGEQRIRGTELAIISLLFLVGGGIFWLYDRGREASERSAAQDTATAISADVAVPAPDAKSIAVLPFADMSPRKDQDYMADGLAEELLNLLAKAPDLKVIARTSSFAFKGEKVPIAEIARKLNVAHVLEGSVRTAGNKVRITAQLVRASDSTHLWSETYDRPLDDIFAVQDEIAGAIAQALQIKLMGGRLTRLEGGTQNLEAYQLYLRAEAAKLENTRSSLGAANAYLEQAIKLDPNYGMGWASLANAVSIETDNGSLDASEGYERARKLAMHALELSPELASAHSILAYIHRTFDWNWAAAEIEVKRALALDPTHVGALQLRGMLSYTLGRFDDAERQFRATLVRDPLNPYVIWTLGFNYYLAGRYEESEAAYRRLLELKPDFQWGRAYLGKTLVAMGRSEAALAVVQQEADEGNRILYLPIVLQAAGRQAEADQALQAQVKYWADTGAFYVAHCYAYRGDSDVALEWLERAYKQKDVGLVEITGEPLLKSLANDPRYKAFLRKMNLPESLPQSAALTAASPT